MKNLLTICLRAYDPGGPKWKLDADGKFVTDSDGNPIYTDSAGAEKSIGIDTVSRLNGEAKSHREAKEAAEAKLAKYEGLDPAEARTAIDKLKQIDQKKLIDAGEVERVKAEISKGFEGEIKTLKDNNSNLENRIGGMVKSQAFANSKYIKDNIAVPVDMFQTMFAGRFNVENDRIVPLDRDGKPMYSPKRHGEQATFDEALEIFVGEYAYKDQILKGSGGSGSGNEGGGGSGAGKRRMSRADFEKLAPQEQSAYATAIREGKAELT